MLSAHRASPERIIQSLLQKRSDLVMDFPEQYTGFTLDK